MWLRINHTAGMSRFHEANAWYFARRTNKRSKRIWTTGKCRNIIMEMSTSHTHLQHCNIYQMKTASKRRVHVKNTMSRSQYHISVWSAKHASEPLLEYILHFIINICSFSMMSPQTTLSRNFNLKWNGQTHRPESNAHQYYKNYLQTIDKVYGNIFWYPIFKGWFCLILLMNVCTIYL